MPSIPSNSARIIEKLAPSRGASCFIIGGASMSTILGVAIVVGSIFFALSAFHALPQCVTIYPESEIGLGVFVLISGLAVGSAFTSGGILCYIDNRSVFKVKYEEKPIDTNHLNREAQ